MDWKRLAAVIFMVSGLGLGVAACGEEEKEGAQPKAAAPRLQNFVAILNIMPGGAPNFYVTGEVEVPAGNYDARLVKREAAAEGVLALDLLLEQTGDMGTQALQWRLVRYDEPASAGEEPPYTEAEIYYEGALIERIPNVTVAQ